MMLPYFGTLDPAETTHETTVELDGRPIRLELSFSGPGLASSAPQAKRLERFLGGLASHARRAKAFLVKDLGNKQDTTVQEFLEFHLEELPPKTLARLLDATSTLSKERQLLSKLVVERIGLDPDAKGDGFAIFDHTFEGNKLVNGRRTITDQIIAVYLDAKGSVGHLAHES
ncbi:hypothetical protein BH11MYX1_BH11MYX1_12280 [soil metagenome]